MFRLPKIKGKQSCDCHFVKNDELWMTVLDNIYCEKYVTHLRWGHATSSNDVTCSGWNWVRLLPRAKAVWLVWPLEFRWGISMLLMDKPLAISSLILFKWAWFTLHSIATINLFSSNPKNIGVFKMLSNFSGHQNINGFREKYAYDIDVYGLTISISTECIWGHHFEKRFHCLRG